MLEELDLAYDDGDAADMRGGRHRRRRSARGKSAFTLILVVAMLALLGGAGFWGVGKVRAFFTPADYDGKGYGHVEVQVHTGDTAAEIANTLYRHDVVKSAKAFVDAATDNPNSTGIQPGFYRVAKHMKASLAVLALLDSDNRIVTSVTIPEGYTANHTLTILSQSLHVPMSDFQQAIKNPAALGIPSSWYARDDGKKVKPTEAVEGFLFPATYSFDPGTTAKDALSQMVSKFMQEAAASGLDKVTGVSPYEALIVASLVQAESGVPSDDAKISRVVYNRLNNSDSSLHYLQFDSTVNYWLELNGKNAKQSGDLTYSELHDPSNPYNTYAHLGLPPGPIDCPGLDAMNATVHPANGNWVYFVRINKDGHSAFTNDYNTFLHDQQVARSRGLL